MSLVQSFFSAFLRVDSAQPMRVSSVKKLDHWIKISVANGIATDTTKSYLQMFFANVPFELVPAETFLGAVVRVSRIQMPEQPYRLGEIFGLLEAEVSKGWYLGIGNFGPKYLALRDLTHAQVYGASGFGKSTFFRFLLGQTLATQTDCMNFIIDPKRVDYNALSIHPRVAAVATTVEQWGSVFGALMIELSLRERLFSESFASPPTSLEQYREFKERFNRIDLPNLPRIMVWIDEAHMVLKTEYKEEFLSEAPAILVKKGRALGLHLIVSSQRPSDIPSAIRSQASTTFLFYLSDANSQAISGLERFTLKMRSIRGRMQGLIPANEALFEVQTPNATAEEALALAFGSLTPNHAFPTPHGLLPLKVRPDLIRDFRLPQYCMEGRSIDSLQLGKVAADKMTKPRITSPFQYPDWYDELEADKSVGLVTIPLTEATSVAPIESASLKNFGSRDVDEEIDALEILRIFLDEKEEPGPIPLAGSKNVALPIAAPHFDQLLELSPLLKTSNLIDADRLRELYLKMRSLGRNSIGWCRRDLRQNAGLRSIVKSLNLEVEILDATLLLDDLAMSAVNRQIVARHCEDLSRWEAGGRAPLLVVSGRAGMGKRTLVSTLAQKFGVPVRDRTDADLLSLATVVESPDLEQILGLDEDAPETTAGLQKKPAVIIREFVIFESLNEVIHMMRHGSSRIAPVLIQEDADGFLGPKTEDIGYLKEHHYHVDLRENDFRDPVTAAVMLKRLYKRFNLKSEGPRAYEFFAAGVDARPAAFAALIARGQNRSLFQDRPFDADVMRDVLETFSFENRTISRRVDVIKPTKALRDLIVGDETLSDLNDIIHRAKTLNEETFLFVSKLRKRGRMIALFAGLPGTGKSMAAEVIAAECGKDLWIVDMSRLLGAYVGETEAALTEVFQTSASAGAVLLLDEADAFLSARTGTQADHTRRWVNHLLNLMEAHHGIVILTTNHAESLDSAFSRRIDIKAEFTAPTDQQLAKMADLFLKPDAPLALGFDFLKVVAGLELSGGLLRNGLERAYLKMRRAGHTELTNESVRAALIETRDENEILSDGQPRISMAP